jgi:hypothetical protein
VRCFLAFLLEQALQPVKPQEIRIGRAEHARSVVEPGEPVH